LEQSIPALWVQIGTTGEMGGLLEKDSFWAIYLTSIDGDFLWRG
jgi:hypothetical protein